MALDSNYSLLYKLAKKLLYLKVEDARLVLSVKITKLLGAIVYLFVEFMLLLCLLGFLASAIGHLLCNVMQPVWAYTIIATFYLILTVVVVLAKKSLIINPIARMVSKLIVEQPNS